MNQGTWGRDDLMVLAAFRYCLGRQSYIVGDCTEWLAAHWDEFLPAIKRCIQREIEEAFARDNEDREENRGHKRLGADCDRKNWETVRKLWNKQTGELHGNE